MCSNNNCYFSNLNQAELLSGNWRIVSIEMPSLFKFEVILAKTPGISLTKILK